VDAAAVSDPGDVRTWPIWESLLPHARVLVDQAEAEGIAAPTARLLNELELLFMTKAGHAEAEPLMRRALAIDQASLGPEHPNVARDLNNLAMLLQTTNRLREAEPLMRRHLLILPKFTRDTGHRHPNLQAAFVNYQGLLQAIDLPEGEPARHIASLGMEAGFNEAEFRELLGALSSGE
jgi:hypothetical protein